MTLFDLPVPTKIDRFEGEWFWLSNFYEEDGYTVEHAYQAAKTNDPNWVSRILYAETPKEAKRLGRLCPVRPNWDNEKLYVMRALLFQKFHPTRSLAVKLANTGTAELIEGNWWDDTYWGVCKGVGDNHLGKLLMHVREAVRHEDLT